MAFDPMQMMMLMSGVQGFADNLGAAQRGAPVQQQGGGMREFIPMMAMMQRGQAQNQELELQRQQFAAAQQAAQREQEMLMKAAPAYAERAGIPVEAAYAAMIGKGGPFAEALAKNMEDYTVGDIRFSGLDDSARARAFQKADLGAFDPLSGQTAIDPAVVAAKRLIARDGRADQRVIIPPGPNAYENTRYTDAGKQWSNIQNAAVASSQRLADLKMLDAVLAGEKTGGLLQDEQLALERLAGQMGLPVDKESIADRQYAQQLATKMLLNQINAPSTEMVGVLSKTDTDMYKEMQPGLGTTPEGRKLAIEVEEALNEHARKLASGMRQYERQKGGIMTPIDQYDYLDAFAQQNSALKGVYEKWKARGKGAQPPPSGNVGGAEPPPVPRGGKSDPLGFR